MFGVLQVIHGPDQGQRFVFGKHDMPIGRAADLGATGIRLNDPRVSRVHCRLEWQGERVLISDAGSGGGTWVNGERLSVTRELQPGDVVVIGETYLEFTWSRDDEKATIAWQPPPGEGS